MVRLVNKRRSNLQVSLFIALFVFSLRPIFTQEGHRSITQEHDDNILGFKLGMDVKSSLKSVFENGNRHPGQEKPDALRHEGNGGKDIRVVYNDLKVGKLQIVFADGKWVKEVTLEYAQRPTYSDLLLPPNGNIFNAIAGQRYDDRYTIGYTEQDEAKRQ